MQKRPQVLRPAPSKEFFFREGCHLLELVNDPVDPDLSIARARVAPGVQTRPHRLAGTVERYYILSGHGRVFLGEDAAGRAVEPGDVVWIPAGVTQSIRNDGSDELVFLALCTPRFEERNYAVAESARRGESGPSDTL